MSSPIGIAPVAIADSIIAELLALGHEALYIPDSGETLVAGRVSSAPDLSGHGYTVTQAVAGKRPLLSGGSWQFRNARTDVLSSAAPVALGTAAYTVWWVALYPNVQPATGRVVQNGTVGATGQQVYVAAGGSTASLSHYTPALAAQVTVAAGTGVIVASVARWNGVNASGVVKGTPWGPAALAAPVAPVGFCSLGNSNAGTVGADADIYALGFLPRAITDPEMTYLRGLCTGRWGTA